MIDQTSSGRGGSPMPMASPIYIRPRPKLDNEVASSDHIGINLPSEMAVVQTGRNQEWTLSLIKANAPIAGFTIYEGNPATGTQDETSLNCSQFSSPRRIEFVASDVVGAAPFLIIQEVANASVTNWQVYAPDKFLIASSPAASAATAAKWQYAVSDGPVAVKQVRFYQSCNFPITTTPPSVPGALFERITTSTIDKIDIWR